MNKDFLDFLEQTDQPIFIEAEAISKRMGSFITSYNSDYNCNITNLTDGICILGDVDKWGVELRIYFNDINNIPNYWDQRKYKNKLYRSEQFSYRLDDNNLVNYLFSKGYRIGLN